MKELSFKSILNQLFTFINVYVGKVQQDNLQMCPLYKVGVITVVKMTILWDMPHFCPSSMCILDACQIFVSLLAKNIFLHENV